MQQESMKLSMMAKTIFMAILANIVINNIDSCHGWASGPTAFLSENIAGIEILEPGCKKIKICPDLAGLEWVNIDFPTPYGIVRIECRCVDDKTNTNVTAPDGVEIVY